MLEGGSLFLELINDILYMVSYEGKEHPTTAKLSYVNSKVGDITGYSPEEFLKDSRLWISMVHPEDRSYVASTAEELIKDKEAKARIYRVKTKEGNYIWVEDRLIPILEDGRVIGFVGVARDITKRKIIEDTLYLALEQELSILYEKVALWLRDALRADLVVIYEVPDGSEEGILVAGEGINKRLIGRLKLPLREGTEFHYTFTSNSPVVIEDTESEDRFKLSSDTFLLSLKSGLCIPIKGKEKPFGTVCIYHKSPRRYTDEEINFATTVAGILGSTIQRKRFEKSLEESEKRLQKMNSLYRTLSAIGETILYERDRNSLLRKACDICHEIGGFTACWVAFLEGSKPVLVASSGRAEEFTQKLWKKIQRNIKRGMLPCGESVRTTKPVITNDSQELEDNEIRKVMLELGFNSTATVPIVVEGKVVGIFSVYSTEKNFFDEEISKLLTEIGEEISYAMKFIEKEEQVGILTTAIEQSSDWVLITDRDGVIKYVNRAVEEVSGYKRSELIGKKPNIFKSGLHPDAVYRNLWDTILKGKTYRMVFINRRKNGELFHLDETITPIKNGKNRVVGFVATGKDVTQEREMRERIRYLAYYDPVTDLPNRSNFMERLRFSLLRMRAMGRPLAVMLIDVDRFKMINDTYGFTEGDNLLREIGRRIKNSIGEGDTIARLGSDEFGLILMDITKKEDIPRTINRIFSAMEEPFRIGGEPVRLTLSVGIAVFPDDGTSPEDLTQKAEIALSHSRDVHSNTYQFFHEEMNQKMTEVLQMEKELLDALDKKEYLLLFQPYYNLRNQRIYGIEALLRWNRNKESLVSPAKFIPVLEETGLIIDVGEWVLKEACKRIAMWEVPISVNISPVQFKDESFIDKVEGAIRRSGIEGGHLILEITEDTVMENVEFASLCLKTLKRIGVRVAVDDFGTGYSSLAYLKKLPVDFLKIDVSFVRDIHRDPDDRAIVNAIIQLAKNLGLTTIAEGIEEERHLEILRDMGCDIGQGFLLAKPMRDYEVPDLIRI